MLFNVMKVKNQRMFIAPPSFHVPIHAATGVTMYTGSMHACNGYPVITTRLLCVWAGYRARLQGMGCTRHKFHITTTPVLDTCVRFRDARKH